MSYRLPSLNGLRAFEAAARHLSFKLAARELRVSPGAVGQHIRALEKALGVPLFERRHRALALTAAGAAYLPAVSGAFSRISAATERVARTGRRRLLTVGAPPDLAANWLTPGLASFRTLHPDIDVRVVSGAGLSDLAQGIVDAIIECRAAPPRDLRSDLLAAEKLVVVCSPKAIAGAPALRRPADLAHHVILHDGRADAWCAWLRANRMTGVDPSRSVQLGNLSAVLAGVAEGRGIALAGEILVRRDAAAGRVAVPFRRALATGEKYFLCSLPGAAECSEIAAFRAWLRDAVRSTQAGANGGPRHEAPIRRQVLRDGAESRPGPRPRSLHRLVGA
jgi:LysR family glycine cleavage system transcriptional activator